MISLLVTASTGLVGAGLFVSQVIRNHQLTLQRAGTLAMHNQIREEAEDQLRAMVETSPLAVVTVDSTSRILLANEAAQNLFDPDGAPIIGERIADFLPALQAVPLTQDSRSFRTELRCRGKRRDGETFLAGVWFSTYVTAQGPRLAALVVDLSEDLRDREELSLNYLLKNTTILMSAVAHEMRNLSGAILAAHANLSRLPDLRDNEDFRALKTLAEGLENLSGMELRPSLDRCLASTDLSMVLDELGVLIGPSYLESGAEIVWRLHENIPLVVGDRHGLQQVFLNLVKNSKRAMRTASRKQLTISTEVRSEAVVIRFADTGPGVSSPQDLFRPFQRGADATGLGLYVSRSILRSFRGDLQYEPARSGACFAVTLPRSPLAASSEVISKVNPYGCADPIAACR